MESKRGLPVIRLGNDSLCLFSSSRLVKHLSDGGILLTAHTEGMRIDHHAVCISFGIRVGIERVHVRHVIICWLFAFVQLWRLGMNLQRGWLVDESLLEVHVCLCEKKLWHVSLASRELGLLYGLLLLDHLAAVV